MGKRHNKLIIFSIKVLVSSVLLYAIIKKAGLQSLGDTLKGTNPYYFLLASLLYVLSIYVSSLRWKVLLWNVRHLRVSYLFLLYITGSFFSLVLPGIIGGDALRIYYLNKSGVRLSESAGSTFLDRYTGYIGLLITALLGAILGHIKSVVYLVLLGLCGLFVITTLLLLRFRFGRRLLRLEDFYNYFMDFFKRPSVLWTSVGLSVVVQAMVVLSVYAVMEATGVNLSLWALFAYMTIIITAATLPVSISGLGIREWTFVALFGLSGIPAGVATGVSLLWYLSYVIGALPGAVGYLVLKAETG